MLTAHLIFKAFYVNIYSQIIDWVKKEIKDHLNVNRAILRRWIVDGVAARQWREMKQDV